MTRMIYLMLFFFLLAVFWAWEFMIIEFCKSPALLTHLNTWIVQHEDNCTPSVLLQLAF